MIDTLLSMIFCFFFFAEVRVQVEKNRNHTTYRDDDVIDLREIFYLLKQHLLQIILCLLMGGGLMFAYAGFIVKPLYTATTKMYVFSSGSSSVIDIYSLELSSQLKSDYAELITSEPIIEDVISNLSLDMKYSALAAMVSVENPEDTRILNVSVTYTDPQMAADIANEIASQTKKHLPEIMKTDAPYVFKNAEVPTDPVSPNKKKYAMMGAAGLAGLYICIIVAKYLLDDTFKTAADINNYFGVQPLTSIPEVKIKGMKTHSRDKKHHSKTRRKKKS